MFEAHTLDSVTLDLTPANSPASIDLGDLTDNRYHRSHCSSLRPLTIWFAEGKRKDRRGRIEATLFTYIEYRDNLGNQRFHCLEERLTPEPAAARLERLLQQAVSQPLQGL